MSTTDVSALAQAITANPKLRDELLALLGVNVGQQPVAANGPDPKVKAAPPTHKAHNIRCPGCGRFNWIPLDADVAAVPDYPKEAAAVAPVAAPVVAS
jgi:hypothetical protein